MTWMRTSLDGLGFGFLRLVLAGLVGLIATLGSPAHATAQPAIELVHGFVGAPARPYGAPIQGADGALYGTTRQGGRGYGTVYRLNPDSSFEIVHAFSGHDGAYPEAGLTLGSDGFLYGTTVQGGTADSGTVYRFDTANGLVETLHSFANLTGGRWPSAGLTQASDGFLYGTTTNGGVVDCGTIYRLDPATGTLTTIHFFTAVSPSGRLPKAAPIQANDGFLYGSTTGGGTTGQGTLYRLNPATGAVTTIHSFTSVSAGGASPQSALTQASDGFLYGTTDAGGTGGGAGLGTVYRLDTATNTVITIHSFTGVNGTNPRASLTQASDGMLYGTTYLAGPGGGGAVYRLNPASRVVTTVNALTGAGGRNPYAGVTQIGGFLYGTTSFDTGRGSGTIYRVDPATNATITIHSFHGTPDGDAPQGAPTRASNGFLYGATALGGVAGYGALYRANPATGAVTTIHTFTGMPSSGMYPPGSLTEAGDGLLYGTTATGGAAGYGMVYRLDPATESVTPIHSFTGMGSDARNPSAALIRASDGNLYGVTSHGGAAGVGAVYRLDPSLGTVTTVVSLPNWSTAWNPPSSLAEGSGGFLYGTTQFGGATDSGTVFRVDPVSGTVATFYSFTTAGGGGVAPRAAPVLATDGLLYGTTSAGGAGLLGTVYRLDPATGNYATLHSFTKQGGGFAPQTALVQADDGFLYGMTSSGAGAVFRVDPLSGAVTILASFSPDIGGNPRGGLAQASDGNLYGTMSAGGPEGGGTIFRVVLNRAPVATDGAIVTDEDQPVTSTLAGTDPDGNPLTFAIVANGTLGTATITNPATGAFTYTPNPNAFGTDTFTFQASDGVLTSNVATVTATINQVDEPAVVQIVLPGDATWGSFANPGATIQTGASAPRSGLGSLELTSGLNGNAGTWHWAPSGTFGTYSQLSTLSFDWMIDPASVVALPPRLLLRVYPWGDPRSFFLTWDTCSPAVPCLYHPTGVWQTTNLMGRLSIQPDGSNIPPASLAEIPGEAPITEVQVWGDWGNWRPWFGFVDNVTIGFAGQSATVFNFEVTDPTTTRLRPTITWNRPATVSTGTPLSNIHLNATATVPGTFTYTPPSGTTLPADIHTIGVDFTPADTSAYLPVSQIVPFTVTGTRIVRPTDFGFGHPALWGSGSFENGGTGGITTTAPRAGGGSLEFSHPAGGGFTAWRDDGSVFGSYGELSRLTFDWLIDPANAAALPPELSLRVYPYGDPRTFLLVWDTCQPSCGTYPAGVWQSSDVLGQLSIRADQYNPNPPPASLAAIPADAPIVGVSVATNWGLGEAWHGFVDNIAIAFRGEAPIVYNFEPELADPVAVDGAVTTEEDTAVAGTVAASDPNGDPLTFAVVTTASHGTLALDAATGAFTYTPAANFHGSDSFSFQAHDGTAASNVATVVITVTAINDSPVAQNATIATNEDVAYSGLLSATDVDNTSLTYAIASNGTLGTVVVTDSSTGAFTYTPNPNAFGTDSFTFRASDGTLTSNVATVTVTIAQVDEPPVVQTVLPGDATWHSFSNPGATVQIGASAPRSGLGSLEFTTGLNGNSGMWHGVPGGAFGTYGQLSTLSFDWMIDPASVTALPPRVALRVYPFGDPRSFYLTWDTCSTVVPCLYHPTGVWQTTDLMGRLSIQPDGSNIPPASLAAIPTDAPITEVQVWGQWGDWRPWFGFVDNVTIGFAGQSATVFNFEVTDPTATRLRPTITWNRPPTASAGTPLSNIQLNATANVPGTFTYAPPSGTALLPDLHTLGVNFTPANGSAYLPVSQIVPFTVTGTHTVRPSEFAAGAWSSGPFSNGGGGGISTAAPRAGSGSLELSHPAGGGFAAWHDPGLPFGTYAELSTLSMDWFIDPANAAAMPAELALRVYPYGDPRTFFLVWDTCQPSCSTYPTGVWQSSNLLGGQLSIRADTSNPNPPPASLAAIPADAPIVGMHIWSNWGFGEAWRGFVDNIAIGFRGEAPIVYNFEPELAVPLAEDSAVTTAEDTAVSGIVSASDPNGDPLTFAVITAASHGTLALDAATGAFTYTPAPNFHGTDTFTFRANDGSANSNVATVTISVTPLNDAPVAQGSSLTTTVGVGAAGTIAGSDVDGDTLRYLLVSGPANGTLVLNPTNGVFTYTPTAGFAGADAFQFSVSDGQLSSATATTQILVRDVTAPVVVPPPPITVYATLPGGVSPSTVPALAQFLSSASANDDVDPSAAGGQTPTLNGAAISPVTVFPLGVSTVTFSYIDTSGNVGSATSTVTVIGGSPRIALRVMSVTTPAPGQRTITMEFTNTGMGNALNLAVNLSNLRTLTGSGTVTTLAGPVPPAQAWFTLPVLGPGERHTVTITLNVPASVRRFAITEAITMFSYTGARLTSTATQTVFP